jgi:hypothetical protein
MKSVLSARVIGARSLALASGLVVSASAVAAQVDSLWLAPASGTWSTGANWSMGVPNNGVPAGTTYRAIIDATGAAYTVTLNTSAGVDELVLDSLDATLTHTSGTFSAALANLLAGTYRLQGGTISGGTWNVSGGSFVLTTSGGTLTDVDFNGDLLANTTSAFSVVGGSTRFDAYRLQANSSDLRMNAGYVINDAVVVEGAALGSRFLRNNQAGSFTISNTGSVSIAAGSGGDLSIQALFGNMNLTNDGLISAEASGRTLNVQPNIFTNNGTMRVVDGILTVNAANWSNAGTIEIQGGTLNLDGGWNIASGIGTFNRTGGTVNLAATVNNAGGSFDLDDTTGSWRLIGGSITGGTVNSVNGNTLLLTSSGGTLTDVDFNGELLANATSAFAVLGGSTRFDAYRLQGNSSDLRMNAGYVINDAVVVDGAAAGTRFMRNNQAGSFTISNTGSVTLAAGSGGDLSVQGLFGAFDLTNEGVISAEASGRTLTVQPSTFTNNGTMRVVDGTLSVNAANWSNAGTIEIQGGTLNLDGGWNISSGIGTFNRTGGTVNLSATVNNAGGSFDLDDTTGSWRLFGGSITGGTVNSVNGNTLTITNSGGTLTDLDFNGDLIANATSAFSIVGGSTRFDAYRLQANSADLRMNAGYVINDAVIAEGAATGPRFLRNNQAGSFTISNTGSVTLAAGSGGDLSVQGLFGAFDLTNNGLISSEASGRTLTVQPGIFTNSGTMRVTDGTLAVSSANWSNAGTIEIQGGTLNLDGGWNVSSGIGTFNRTGGTVNLSATVNNAGGSFDLDDSTGSWRLVGGTINGGTVNSVNGNTLILTSSGGTLTDVDFNGDLLANATSAFAVVGGSTRFDAYRLQASSTDLRMNAGYVINDAVIAEGAAAGPRFVRNNQAGLFTISNTGSMTLAAGSGGDLSVQGLFGAFDLANNGLISAEASGRTLTVQPNTFTNNATMRVVDGTLRINAGSWSNVGTIEVQGGTLNLDGGWNTTSGIGTFNRTGGTVNLAATVNNAGGSFDLDDTTGSWRLLGGSITGGTVNSVNGNTLSMTSSGGTLTDVEFNGDLLANATSAFSVVGGSTRFDAYRLQANSSDLRMNAGYVINDAVIVEGAALGSRFLRNNQAGTFTISSSGSVTLAAGSGGDLAVQGLFGNMDLTNEGLISAEAAGRTLTVQPTTFTNNGTLAARNGSTLRVASSGVHVNDDNLVVGTGGRIEFANGFEQAASGVFRVELSSGVDSGAGRIAVTGDASLGGSLVLDPVNGFTPDWGDAWTVATYTTRTGDFDTVDVPTLTNADYRWWSEVNATNYRLGVRHFADLNYDGTINFNDLNTVLSNFGTMVMDFRLGDTNDDGLVNFTDLNAILSNFGLSAPRAVPTPGAAALLAFGLAFGGTRRRQR